VRAAWFSIGGATLLLVACSSNSGSGGGSSNLDGGSTNSSTVDAGASNSSPDGSPLASSDKDKCALYLTCLNVADQAAYANQLALYGDSSACWKDSTTSANCASACVSAYAQIAPECSCTSATSCTPCASAKLPISTTLYSATATTITGSCPKDLGEVFVSRNADGKVVFGTPAFPVGPFYAEVNTLSPMTCDGVSTLSWSGGTTSDTHCAANLALSGTLTTDGSGPLSLTFSISVTSIETSDASCHSMPVGSSCTGTFTLTPKN
jgi:hypothetical protein